jgi:type IV pilus assembly protein PilF
MSHVSLPVSRVAFAASLCLALALAGCGTSRSTPDQPPLKSNSVQDMKLADTATPEMSQSNSVDIKDRNPDSPQRKRARIRLDLGVSYYQDGRFPVALDELKQALADDPTFAEAHGVLALVYMALGENALATASFQRALQLEPGSSDINVNYGWFLCQTGQPAQALPYFDKALQNPLYNQPAKPLQDAGVCALRMGDKAKAEDYFQRSFRFDPSGPVSAYNLALIFYDRKEYARAEFYVNLVNKSNIVSPEALWLGIRIEHALNKAPEEASLSVQLQRAAPSSREAELLARHAYDE